MKSSLSVLDCLSVLPGTFSGCCTCLFSSLRISPLFAAVPVSLPCSDYRPGEDDLQAFDFIRRFKLDVLEKRFPGVSKVRGSNRVQVAYRLDTSADLSMDTRCVPLHTSPLPSHHQGLPLTFRSDYCFGVISSCLLEFTLNFASQIVKRFCRNFSLKAFELGEGRNSLKSERRNASFISNLSYSI